MSLKRKVMIVLVLALLVLLVQMVALGLLGPQRNLVSVPWESKSRIMEQRTLKPHELLHENPESVQTTASSSQPIYKHKDKMASHQDPAQHSQSSQSEHQTTEKTHTSSTATPTATSSSTPKKAVPGFKDLSSMTSRHPVPASAWNCDISSEKDARSALSRAKTPTCKELIHNVTCLHKAGLLYDTSIKKTCPLGPNPGSGVSYYPLKGIPALTSKGVTPVRIVFLFSVHGRAVRQVKRLFKALYHSDHYYYIHVDSRSDYMYRRLYEDMSDYPNVYFPTWRMATIWGGASLLQMMLMTLTDLEKELTDWTWDYLINLSESDYPVRTNDELVEFLTIHRGKNFVKTHGGELKKFIMKQGLDRTFVECDNHMWRVGNRPLPPDINVDGGSDWIAIHRNYSRYLVTGKDPLLVGLKRYYQYTLLPAESFFHTVLRNGHMCSTFIKTNLRVTNWNRKLGCRCQYKHIVDWCGCSPNDFLEKDITKLKSFQGHHFIARKFEAIVSQVVIEQLDAHLYGPLPSTMPGLSSYWESMFHVEDDIARPSDAGYTAYQSFLRIALKDLYKATRERGGGSTCGIPSQAAVKEVSVLRKGDGFVGLVVTIYDALSDKLNSAEFEALFTPIPHTTSFDYDNKVARRIMKIEVGSNWDGKESIFRNYGGILGVWDEPVVALRLKSGEKGSVTILWYDPLGVQTSSQTVDLDSGWFVAYQKPKLARPIRPGVWTVKVELSGNGNPLLTQQSFLVSPLTHTEMNPMAFPQQVNAKRIPTGGKELFHPSFMSWKRNITKTGTELEQWVDDLMVQFWGLQEFCRSTAQEEGPDSKGSSCDWLPYCASSAWSTLSPDPKSELPRLSEVGANGRIR